ncbi:Rne/Rng family ribonuclease [Lichenicoccus sp.]|uniref:Rne/Rng family ribonuclease n=1 Tax=Lichenicoccus sp. TaxID=2781899 RepID=UPI003D0A861F
MDKRMLIDTTHAEETRVVVLDGDRLEDYDVETSAKKQLKGNIYLAKVIRVEPSLQAAFIEYGGNRHGFLAFGEIHPDYYQIPVADRERLIALQEEEARAEEAREEAREQTEAADPEQPAQIEGDAGAARAASEDTRDGADDQPDEPEDDTPPESLGGEADSSDERAALQSARFLRQYKIQEVIRRRQILLVQVVKEERGNKGAALTTYISLAGRFCVLMPNSLRGGGVSRKITSAADRRRLKEITAELDIPRGMAMIIRTAGAQRPRPEIRRDCEYLLQLWDDIRDQTLRAMAPSLVYEEANLIKRAIRDVYTRDIEEIVVDGETGWKAAREFMRNLMPANASKVSLWRDHGQPLFSHYQVEHHLDAMLQPTVQLRSGGYLVINQTEALVAIDVNSGRSTRERGIEETALRTNLEAADEVARQLRLRDLAGLIVIDFIDMEARRNNAMVERRLKDALKNDRARIQVGQISSFGLMEMSRQRLRPSIAESSFVACPHCAGTGFVRGTDSAALHVLRAIEEEGARQRSAEIAVHVPSTVALYVLNNKRVWLAEIEQRHRMTVSFAADDSLIPPQLRIEKLRPQSAATAIPSAANATLATPTLANADVASERRLPANGVISRSPEPAFEAREAELQDERDDDTPSQGQDADDAVSANGEAGDEERKRKRRRRRRRGGRREDGATPVLPGVTEAPSATQDPDVAPGLAPEPGLPAEQAAAEAPRRRGRGTGGRHRPPQVESGSQPGPQPGYRGPTPADPFGGSYDIFELIDHETDVPSVAPAAPDSPPEPAFQAEPQNVAAVEPESAPPAEPEDAHQAEPDAHQVTAEASLLSETAPAAASKPKRARATPKAAAPRAAAPRSRAATPPKPDTLAAAPEAAAEAPPVKPKAPRKSRAKQPAPDLIASMPPAEPSGEPDPAARSSVVQPILIDTIDAPPARRTGWWKR